MDHHRASIVQSLQDILSELFRKPITVLDDSKASDFDGWDSLCHIQIMIAIERRFGVRFSVKEVRTLSTLGELVSLIEKKLVTQG